MQQRPAGLPCPRAQGPQPAARLARHAKRQPVHLREHSLVSRPHQVLAPLRARPGSQHHSSASAMRPARRHAFDALHAELAGADLGEQRSTCTATGPGRAGSARARVGRACHGPPRACTWCSAASSHQSPALCMRHTCSPRSSCACAGALHHKHSVPPGTGRGTLRAPGARPALLLRAGPARQPNTRCLARQAPKGSTLRAPPATLSITLPGKCWAFC